MQVWQLQKHFCNNYYPVWTYFRFRRFWYEQKKRISMDHDSITNSWKNHEDEWSLTWYFWWGIYTSIPTWTSQNSLVAAEALSLSYDQMIRKTIAINTQIVKSHAMKQSILLWIQWKVNGNWDSNMIRIPQWMESHCRTNTSIRRKK